jgi:hypothetical protein
MNRFNTSHEGGFLGLVTLVEKGLHTSNWNYHPERLSSSFLRWEQDGKNYQGFDL